MKKIKRIVRLFALVILIVLASLGIGLSGGVPLPSFTNRKESEIDNTELIEDKEEQKDQKQSLYKI